MPRLLPRVVQTLITQSADATRVRDGLTNAIQPTLDFLNKYFIQAADGSLTLLSKLTAKAATFTGDVQVLNGNVLVAGRTNNCLVVVPPAGATAAFYTTNVGNTAALFIVDQAGNCTAPSFSSANGFRSYLEGGTVSAASGATNTYFQHQRVLFRGGNLDQANLVQPMGFSGSVVGIMIAYHGTTTSQNVSVKVQKNNADLWVYNNILTGAGTGALAVKTAAKGAYAFAPNDFLTVLSSYSAGGDIRAGVTLIVETAA